MSRVAKQPISLPKGVEYSQNGQELTVKGPKGSLNLQLHNDVTVSAEDGRLVVGTETSSNLALAGTMRALLNNMVAGVSNGFERKLQLVGVGYRAQAQGNKLNPLVRFFSPCRI